MGVCIVISSEQDLKKQLFRTAVQEQPADIKEV